MLHITQVNDWWLKLTLSLIIVLLYDVQDFFVYNFSITSQVHNPSPSIPLEQFPCPLHSPVAPFTPGQAAHTK